MKVAARRLVATTVLGAVAALSSLTLAGVASGAPSTAAVSVGPAVPTLPNTNIIGTSPHFNPTQLSAVGNWNGSGPCGASNASFTITNKEAVAEDITLKGSVGFVGSHGVIPAKSVDHVCLLKGWSGRVRAILDDGNRAQVTVP